MSFPVKLSSTIAVARPRRRFWRPSRRLRVVTYIALAVGFAVVFRKPLFQNNFGVVDPGRVYRGAQPVGGLAELIRDHHLGSIVNLRGGDSRDSFYAHEVQQTRSKGIDLWDIPLGATRRPTRNELLRILRMFEVCRYPLFIHCKWGSDRTGMVSGLYRMFMLGDPPEQACREFTLLHGHIPLFGPERLHEPFDEYAAWLASQHLAHSPTRLRTWIETSYQSEDPFRGTPRVEPGPRPPGHVHGASR